MKSNNLFSCVAFCILLVFGIRPDAYAYNDFKLKNTTSYSGAFRVLYAACKHDEGPIPPSDLSVQSVVDVDKKKNPPPEVIKEAQRLAGDPFFSETYKFAAKYTGDPYYFYRPTKNAWVYSAVETPGYYRGSCLITTIRATLYDSKTHKTIPVNDYESTGTGYSNFVIQPVRGKIDEFEIVSTDKWWMPLVPVGECMALIFGTAFMGPSAMSQILKTADPYLAPNICGLPP
jgi:hypothetical protein